MRQNVIELIDEVVEYNVNSKMHDFKTQTMHQIPVKNGQDTVY